MDNVTLISKTKFLREVIKNKQTVCWFLKGED